MLHIDKMCCVKSQWFLLLLVGLVQSHKICSLDEKDCMTRIASRGFRYVMDGIKGLIEPTEILYLDKVQGELTPAFKYTLRNITLSNMKKCEVKALEVEKSDLTYTYYLWCPQLLLHLDFEGIGTLGKETLNGDDQAQFKVTLDDYLIIFKGQYGRFISEKDNQPRIFIKKNSIETKIKGKATFEINHLIRGSYEKFKETEAYMNKNTKEMAELVQSPMMEEFMKQFIDKINIYLKTYPLNEVLLDE